MGVGKGLTLTCRESYRQTPTGLGPDVISFAGNKLSGSARGGSNENRCAAAGLLLPLLFLFLPWLLTCTAHISVIDPHLCSCSWS